MKVLQVHNFYRTRGGECSVVDAERVLLESRGHKVVPYYRDSSNIDELRIIDKARTLFRVPYNNAVEKDLTVTLSKDTPDVAHVHNVFPMLTTAVYKALRNYGVPIIQTIHNFRFLCPNGQFYVHNKVCEACQEKGFLSAVKNRCMQNSFLISSIYSAAISHAWKSGVLPNGIDRYIALNQFFADRLISGGIPPSRIRILGNFVSETGLLVSPKKDYVLYLGRLSQEKGIRTLLRAWKNVDGATLRIAGIGPMMQEIEDMIANYPQARVQTMGYVSGIAKRVLIKEAICMVVPSEWYENFPISVLEAMSLGTPVIASNIGGLPEMVNHDKDGLLYETGNSDALTEKLRLMISDRELAARLAKEALNSANNLFSPERHYESLIDIYTDAIDRLRNF